MLEIKITLLEGHADSNVTLQNLQIFNITPQSKERGEETYECTLTTFNVRGNPFRQEQTLVSNWRTGIEDPAALVAKALTQIVSKR